MTLREAIEKGFFNLDEQIYILDWDPDDMECPCEPEEHAARREAKVGSEFELLRGMQCKRPRKYIVTGGGMDDDGCDIDYEVTEAPQ